MPHPFRNGQVPLLSPSSQDSELHDVYISEIPLTGGQGAGREPSKSLPALPKPSHTNTRV